MNLYESHYCRTINKENKKLKEIISEIHSWVVCAGITTPEDMAQNFERIIEITSPNYIEETRKN